MSRRKRSVYAMCRRTYVQMIMEEEKTRLGPGVYFVLLGEGLVGPIGRVN